MSTELAGPVFAPRTLSQVCPPQVGVSALGYPSGLAGPSEIDARSVEQVSPHSVATGIEEADDDTLSSS